MSTARRCIVVGAGMAGLTAARSMSERGWRVQVLDKGKNAGGRMATRRVGGAVLEHGAQFFTARDAGFAGVVAEWESAGRVTPWFELDDGVRYRAVGGMNALAGHLAEGLHVQLQTAVQSVGWERGEWRVVADSGTVLFADALVLTPPAPQTAKLLAGCAGQLAEDMLSTLAQVEYEPCFALLARGTRAVPFPVAGFVRPAEGPFAWIADNVRKGLSGDGAALTFHTGAEFSRRFLEAAAEQVAAALLPEAERWFAEGIAEWQLHRWRYSRPVRAGHPLCLFAELPGPVAIAGDGFGGPRVEGAYLSGRSGAEALAGRDG